MIPLFLETSTYWFIPDTAKKNQAQRDAARRRLGYCPQFDVGHHKYQGMHLAGGLVGSKMNPNGQVYNWNILEKMLQRWYEILRLCR